MNKMTIEYNEKGKYFTNIITKETVPAKIQTQAHLVEGEIHVRAGQRLKDEMDLAEPFLAVTNATLYTSDGQVLLRTRFIAIKREQIVWVTPSDDILKEKNP
jgi:hypothetical protein